MIPLRFYAYGAILVALLAGAWYYGHTRYKAGEAAGTRAVAALKVKQANAEADLAKQREEFQTQARATEQRYAADMARIGREYEEQKQTAGQAGYDRAIAAARSGRLRDIWTCPASVPQIATGPSVGHVEAVDRSEAIGAVLRVAAEGDAQLAACQAVVAADRQ